MKKLLTSLMCVMMVICFMPGMAFAGTDTIAATVQKSDGDEQTYSDIQSAINALEDGSTLRLESDVTQRMNIFSDSDEKLENITIDLNGHSVNVTDTSAIAIGNIKDKSNAGFSPKSAEVTIVDSNSGGTNKISGGQAGILVGVGSLIIDDEIIIEGGLYGISGNGSANLNTGVGETGTVITLNKVSVSSPNGTAIYHPQKGQMNINGGTYSGANGIQMCSGKLVFADGKVIATGEDESGSKRGDGVIPDGAAISAVDRSYPGGLPDVKILNGTFESEHQNAVLMYAWENDGATDLKTEDPIVAIDKGNFDVVGFGGLHETMTYLTGTGIPTLNLTESMELSGGRRLSFEHDVVITADKGKNITLEPCSVMEINANVTFTGFDVGTVIVGQDRRNENDLPGSITVAEGKTLTIKDNHANGMNGGQIKVNNGVVNATNNTYNGISAQIIGHGGSITTTENGRRGLTLNGGTSLGDGVVVESKDNSKEAAGVYGDIEINTNKDLPGLGSVTVNDATIITDTMQGHTYGNAKDREKTVVVQDSGAKIIVKTPVEDTSSVGDNNKTSELFKTADRTTITNGVVVLGNEVAVYGDVTEVSGVKYGQIVVNNTTGNITVVDENNNRTTVAANTTATITKPDPVYPTTPTTQKPVIEADANATVTLSDYGTKATIKVVDGYELVDVTVNGVSKGKVDTLTGLKTGDKVVVTTQKIVTVEDEIAAVKATKLVARSANAKAPSGKKAIKVYWFNKDGSELNFDGYEIYRSTKKNSFGKKPIYTAKKTQYFNTSAKKGTRYYYKVRGYKVIGGEKVYTDFSLKAIRTAK